MSKVSDLNVSVNICREDGFLMTTISTLNGDLLVHKHEGLVECRIDIDDFNLAPGNYVIVMPIHEGHSYLYRDVVAQFVVRAGEKLTWGAMNFDYDYQVLS